MRRVLLTGASGHLGQEVARQARGWELIAARHQTPVAAGGASVITLDLVDESAVLAAVKACRPDAIIHTACSNRTPGQIDAIVPAAQNVARAAAEGGCRLVHVSTDLVFDGENAPYSDEAPLAPLGEYGGAKAEAERRVAAACPSAVIVRPSLIWSLEPLDHQTRWLLDGIRAGQEVTLFTDEIRNPVYLADLAAALLELAARPGLAGALNAGGLQPLSRWEFGRRLLEALKVDARGLVRPALSRSSGLVRARDLTLALGRAGRELQTRLRGVDEVLAARPAAP